MDQQYWKNIDAHAKIWIHQAANLIKDSFTDELMVEFKSNPSDLVTNMDVKIEKFFIEQIHATFPDHRILGEEGVGEEITSLEGTVWIIDPIDGTTNFVHQQRNFAISIGIFHEGIGMLGYIFDVVGGELFHAMKGNGAYVNEKALKDLQPITLEEALFSMNASWVTENRRIDYRKLAPIVKAARGIRSFGSAALELAYVAAGRIDGYLSMRLSPWDVAAGIVLLNEVGGKATTIEGEPLSLLNENTLLASKPKLHENIIKEYINK
ncbi:inositol monophosphatase [Lottiidibacillus patelloidae]|uniref:inositol-phosphate phosphatase n=1 Tax=Lottiidibacillus patelloidae TaxID=2670334 RepID=A0A263BXI1_9BACI|nr:inositol monophosphatase family protein [Lottiidibacillus patelloidae]OZM58439.1 inositol monophosphatase [Lottiidibacillus patelloidae]